MTLPDEGPMNTAASAEEQTPEVRTFVERFSWEAFEDLLCKRGDHGRDRLAYNQGLLEIMAPSFDHESIRRLIGRLIEYLTEEWNLPIQSAGSTTLKRPDQHRAVEADECHYLRHEAAVRGQRTIDLLRDPAPDLVVEIDITRSSVARMKVYAAIGVTEVWQWLGDSLLVHGLAPDGTYQLLEQSLVLPMLPLDRLRELLALRHHQGETEIVRAFRRWVKSLR